MEEIKESRDQNTNGTTNLLLLPPALLLPHDITTRIFSQLDCLDLLHCSLVCNQWYKDSTELREGWRNEYIELYDRLGFYLLAMD